MRRIHFLVAAASLVASTTLSGQALPPGRQPVRVPVTVVLVDSVPGSDAPVRIVRRADMAPHDVVMLRRDAGERVLSDVLQDLMVIRATAGDTARSNALMRLQPARANAGAARREFPWAGRVLAELRRAAPQHIPGIGTHPAVQVWLPPQGRGREHDAPR